jgi:hypothetical protein
MRFFVEKLGRTLRYDVLVVVILTCLGTGLSYVAIGKLPTSIFSFETSSSWFESDVPRVFHNMTERLSDHYRTKVHPLFSLLSYPLVFVLRKGFQFPAETAVRIVIAGVAGLWSAGLYVLLKLITRRVLDATLFALLAMASAASMFWFSVPETYSFGSLTILLSLGLLVLAQRYLISEGWYIAISASTLSFTVTNWMAGLIVTHIGRSWRRTVQISINAFFLVTILWGIEKLIFPSSVFFMQIGGERKYLSFVASGRRLVQVGASFFLHSMVMPQIQMVDRFNRPDWPVMVTQTSLPGSSGILGIIACSVWLLILIMGLLSVIRLKEHKQLRVALSLMIAGQLCLHLLYGDETFLYALHFLPLLVIMTALTTLTRLRPVVLLLVGLLILMASINNLQQFFKAVDFFMSHGS